MSTAELKKLVDNKKLVIGMQRTMKLLKKGSLKKIFLASNTPKDFIETIESSARIMKVEISKLDVSNEDMGVLVKKPFAVTVVSLEK